jgi:hypothetical protein
MKKNDEVSLQQKTKTNLRNLSTIQIEALLPLKTHNLWVLPAQSLTMYQSVTSRGSLFHQINKVMGLVEDWQ